MTPAILALLIATAPPATPVSEGEPAPFSGILLPPERAEALGAKVERCELELRLEKELAKRTLKVKTDAAQASARIREEAAQRALEAAERAWWDDPVGLFMLGMSAGVLVGFAAFAGSVLMVGQLRPVLPAGE